MAYAEHGGSGWFGTGPPPTPAERVKSARAMLAFVEAQAKRAPHVPGVRELVEVCRAALAQARACAAEKLAPPPDAIWTRASPPGARFAVARAPLAAGLPVAAQRAPESRPAPDPAASTRMDVD
jgi:hypothetical protein